MAKAQQASGAATCLTFVALALFLVVGIAWSFTAAFIIAGVIFVLAVVLGVQGQKKRDQLAEAARAQRYESLRARFGDEAARLIMEGRYWQGASFEMVHESLGPPVDVKESVFKTKTETTYLYQQLSPQRFGLKIHFENGVVVGWDA